mmetsp:Transcript_53015/g.123580  ORF Transcript_53015/g.123580 Transcript_53015/m.123580 type:complete len:224 (-) Transcript_53015:533-1204(-)
MNSSGSDLSFFTFFFFLSDFFFFSLSFCSLSFFGSFSTGFSNGFSTGCGVLLSRSPKGSSAKAGAGSASWAGSFTAGCASTGGGAAFSSSLAGFELLMALALPFPAFALLAGALASGFAFSFLSLSFLSAFAVPLCDLSLIAAMSISTPAGIGSGPLASAAFRSNRTIPLVNAFLSTPEPISMALCMEASAPLGMCRLSRTCAKVTKAHGQSACSVSASRRSA